MARCLPMLCLVSLFLTGCGAAPPPTYPLRGTVSFNDKPLANGEVYFILPGEVPLIFPIKDGAFSGTAKSATYRVEICAYRPRQDPVGMPGEKMAPPPENYIPAPFNVQSKLTASVEASGANEFSFAVKGN